MHVKALLDLDMVAMEASDELTLMLDLTAPANAKQVTRPSQAVQIVVDRSGSMEGGRLESAKGSLLKLIDRLAPQDYFGIVSFDDTALVEIPTRKMSDHHLPTLRKSIRELHTGGSTDISAGYLLGLREVNRIHAEGGSTLLLISDGHANAGERDPRFFAEVSSKSATEKVTTSTIGIGTGYDETILESLAKGGGGAHRFAGSIDEAVGAIAAEVDDLLDKTIVNAVLRLTPTAAMTSTPAIEVLQRLPYWKDGESYVVQLGDFYSGENRRFVIKIDLPGVAALGLCKIADITVEYLDLAARQEIAVTMPVNVNVVPGDVAAGRVADPIVRAERLILEAQTAKSLAVDELRSGKIKEASSRLNNTAASLRREASLIPVTDDRSAESLAIIKAEAEEIEVLAKTAEVEDVMYSSKRMTESYSRKTRSRNVRNQPTNPSLDDESSN
ncbi:MAG: VWA domain-containing protein [Actinobacteria bacterium]|nr:VWA domain-containing protein [Actinomycetota bacterium]